MDQNQHHMPLLQKLHEFAAKRHVSFHVPGHKSGQIFPELGYKYFEAILPIDLTELTGLDDLHAPKEVIAEAEKLAADFFKADHTFFLVGGSTVGNLAMILASCSSGDQIIVQRNSHKSIINGMELAGASPIFISPEYDANVKGYTAPSLATLQEALKRYPDAKAVVLTYPDYFGNTYPIEKMIELAHNYQVPVLVDEAHGVHFSLGEPFPPSALELGADVVVQSAHKMSPAMTMASYLHIKSSFISKERITHFLQILQSSSPSYPLLASLDVARFFLATLSSKKLAVISKSVIKVKEVLKTPYWQVMLGDDPLKITLHMEHNLNGFKVASLFEQEGIYPELATYNQVLLIHGLDTFNQVHQVEKAVKRISDQLKIKPNHATINIRNIFHNTINELAINYSEMERIPIKQIPLQKVEGHIAAEAIIPYPPGIPLILKGEKITRAHVEIMELLIQNGATIQHRDIYKGINVYAIDYLEDIN